MRRVVVLGFIPLLFTVACGSDSPTSPSRPTPAPTAAPAPSPTPREPITHTLTMTAAPSCTALPEVAKKRTYPAQVIEKSDGSITVRVVNSTDIMVGWANDSGFTGTRNGNAVRFDVTDDIFAAYAMIERIPGFGDMGYAGTATGTTDSNRKIVATFNGEYRLSDVSPRVLCAAPDHHIEVTPSGS